MTDIDTLYELVKHEHKGSWKAFKQFLENQSCNNAMHWQQKRNVESDLKTVEKFIEERKKKLAKIRKMRKGERNANKK